MSGAIVLEKIAPRKWAVIGPSGGTTYPTKKAALAAIAATASAPDPNPVRRAMRKHNGPALARLLGVSHQAVYRWANEQRPIPGPVRALLTVIMAEEEK